MQRTGDRSPRARLYGAVIAAALLALGGLAWLARSPQRAEAWSAGGPGGALAGALSRATATVPFPLAEPLAGLVALACAAALVRAGWQVARRRRRFANALACGALRVGALLAVAGVLFYATFGLCYARAPLAARLGWPAAESAPLARQRELEGLAAELVLATNRAYREATSADDLGRPSAPAASEQDLDRALDDGLARAAALLGLDARAAAPRGRAKAAWLTPLMTRFGIAGIHIPWTGEALVNGSTPACQRPHTVAHEKAHQRGFASEDEANFVGFLGAALASDPYARYAGLLHAQRQLLFDLAEADDAAARALIARRLPGVQRDVDAARAFWRAHEGPLAEVGQAVNDTYLKAHGVEGGVLSYSRACELIVRFARARGGRADPSASAAPPEAAEAAEAAQ